MIHFNCHTHCGKKNYCKNGQNVLTQWNVLIFLAANRFPYEWNSPVGYLIVIIFEYIILGYQLFIVACTLALGVGAFVFATSISKEIQRILHSINYEARRNERQSNGLEVLFFEYLGAHGFVKQLSMLNTHYQILLSKNHFFTIVHHRHLAISG